MCMTGDMQRPGKLVGRGRCHGQGAGTGPVLTKRLAVGQSVLCRLPRLPAFQWRVLAINMLVTPLTLHGVAIAPVSNKELSGLETVAL